MQINIFNLADLSILKKMIKIGNNKKGLTRKKHVIKNHLLI